MTKEIFLDNKKTIFAFTLTVILILSAIIYSQTIAQTAPPKFKARCCVATPRQIAIRDPFGGVAVPVSPSNLISLIIDTQFGIELGQADCTINSVYTASYCVNGVESAEFVGPGKQAVYTKTRDSNGNLKTFSYTNNTDKLRCLITCKPSQGQACGKPLQAAEGSGKTKNDAINDCNAKLNKISSSITRFMTVASHNYATSMYDEDLSGNGSR